MLLGLGAVSLPAGLAGEVGGALGLRVDVLDDGGVALPVVLVGCRTISANLLFAASRASVLASTASVRSLSGVGAVGVVEPGFVPVVVLAMSSKLRSTFVWTPST